MRLAKIKLSGFKSFVDPTTLIIPGNVVGIVGPNGCGKSNIIDAVTWVMGESSAKHLRGEALTDVIFNGSTNRQPISQASVELIFDNSENKIAGEFASYNEISIKRQINREAVSTYYLNGTRCRRRDITGLFLGTGLGPRGYSIIEQGMISRMIEAKPEEMRSFIEEAAGISKYRERRRETENRIRHAKENIARLNDIQQELEKQLAHLQRQAKAAERYKVLKSEERQCQAELLALNWQQLDTQNSEHQQQITEQQNRVDKALADMRAVESEIEKQRSELSNANDHFNEQQSVYYKLGADISKLEQTIQHTREKIQASEEELNKATGQFSELLQQHEQDQQALATVAQQLTQLEPRLSGSRSESDKAYQGLNMAEQAMQSWQSEWDQFNQESASYVQNLQLSQTRIEHLESNLEDYRHRMQSLREEYDGLEPDSLDRNQSDKQTLVEELENQLAVAQQALDDQQAQYKDIQAQLRQAQQEHLEQQSREQSLLARLEGLQTLQQAALNQDNPDIHAWLSSTHLHDVPRLAQILKADEEWLPTIEMVLADHLQALCVDEMKTDWLSALENLTTGQIEILAATNTPSMTQHAGWHSLADHVQAPNSVKSLLSSVYVADSQADAIRMQSELQTGEAIVARCGLWLTQDWVRYLAGDHTDVSMVARQQQIQQLQADVNNLQSSLREQQANLQQRQQDIATTEQNISGQQEQLQQLQLKLSEARGDLFATESQKQQLAERADSLQQQLEELQQTIERDQAEHERLVDEISSTEALTAGFDQQKIQLESMRERYRSSLDDARKSWQQTHEQSSEIALQLEALSSQKASLEQAIKRSELQQQHIQQRQTDLERLVSETQAPLANYQQQLESGLKDKVDAEKRLNEARTAMQEIETTIREAETKRQGCEEDVQQQREALEAARLAASETKVRLDGVIEQFSQYEGSIQQTLEQLPEDASLPLWQDNLDSIGRKIHRLGAINLAAIDEHAQHLERKEYLDRQEADLNEALETLENAIRKIDQETKSRFKDTFDRLNDNLKTIFPQIFGGGSAYLEMTSQDLLETGVSVMARPPGKRNTSIHLLSGGEKALTAVALVFSIFKLNPAPFCILDEVDAPLDDANAGRFSELVKSMSEDVQFIVITHNKITMEIAQQLLGVTMNEPGVSRLVSVDVDAAVEMAANA